jgi:competence protein ComEC
VGSWVLAVAAAGLWGGVLLAGVKQESTDIATGAVLLATGLLALAGHAAAGRSGGLQRLAIVGACFVLLGAGWASIREARRQTSPLALMVGRSVTVRGALEEEPESGMFGWTASIGSESVWSTSPGLGAAVTVRDRLWVQGHGRPPALSPGDRVEVGGILVPLRGDFGSYLRHRGYPATLAAVEIRWRGPPSTPWMRAAQVIRTALRGSLERLFPHREAGLLMGLLLGDTTRLEPGVEEDFRATGLSHLTAVSGQNLVMFVAPLLAVVTAVGMGRRGRFAVGLTAVCFFVLLAGGEPSVMRAAAMAGLTLLGVFLGRPRSPPAILGGAILILLTGDPTLAYATGFQLSVAATAGIALLAGPISGRLGFLPGPLALAAGATLGAQAGVTPLLLYHFGVVPVVSIPANLLAFPAVAPAMLVGLAAGAVGLVWHGAGVVLSGLARIPLEYLELLADRLARSPLPSITSPGRQILALVAGSGAVAAAGWWLRSGRPLPRRALLVVAVALPLFAWSGALKSGPPGALTVTFFDVGQGDAALVRSPGGAAVLIDGGPDDDQVARELAALGVRRLDLVAASHSHTDHVAGLPSVLSRFPVSVVVDPGCEGDSPYYSEMLRAVEEAGVPFEHPAAGAVMTLADLRIDVLGPDRCYSGTESDANNDSLVLRVSAGGATVLFTGDAEEPAQRDLLVDAGHLLPALVLKVPHHGGDTSMEEFLRAVKAVVAVVSVGPNRYGHPSPEVLADLTSSGVRVFRTDLVGDVTLTFRGREVLVSTDP